MSRALTGSGRRVRGDQISVASANLEAAGTVNGAAFDTSRRSTIVATLAVTAVSGSPTLDVKLQTCDDTDPTSGTWSDVAAFAQKTGVASELKRFTGLGRWCRWVRVVAGTSTPRVTYTITGYSK